MAATTQRSLFGLGKPGVVLLIALVLAASTVVLSKRCSDANPAPVAVEPGATVAAVEPGATPAPTPMPVADAIIVITRGGKVVRAWNLDGLRAAVPFAKITVDGEEQNGPLFGDLLAASGVTTWTHAEAIGKGPALATSITLQIDYAKVDGTWVFDVNNRGKLKLAAGNVSRQDWIRDVSEIRID